MSKRKKIIIAISTIIVGGLLFFEGRRITFTYECLQAEKELDKNFSEKKTLFYDLSSFLDNLPPIEFDLVSKDTVWLTFHDSSINYASIFIDSNYYIGPDTKKEFRINDSNCLEVIEFDTIEVCNHNWKITFHGHYKNPRINNLLNYYGWSSEDFKKLVDKVTELNCNRFSSHKGNFGLGYKTIYYAGFATCFGHSDGYFDYLYTNIPDSFYWYNSLTQLEGDFYTIKNWTF